MRLAGCSSLCWQVISLNLIKTKTFVSAVLLSLLKSKYCNGKIIDVEMHFGQNKNYRLLNFFKSSSRAHFHKTGSAAATSHCTSLGERQSQLNVSCLLHNWIRLLKFQIWIPSFIKQTISFLWHWWAATLTCLSGELQWKPQQPL